MTDDPRRPMDIVLLLARQQVVAAVPTDEAERAQARGVMAGALAASQALLSPAEFDRLHRFADLDHFTVDALLALTRPPGAPAPDTSIHFHDPEPK